MLTGMPPLFEIRTALLASESPHLDREIIRKGFDAAGAGASWHSCPYRISRSERQAWLLGYCLAH